MRHRRAATAAGALLVTLAVVTGAAADDTYVGTVTVPQEGGPPISVPLTLTIRQDTSDERANALATLLHDRGHAAVAADLAKEDLGLVRLGETASFRVTVVRKEPTTAGGQVLRVTTDRPMFPGMPPVPAPPPDALGYLELTLGSGQTGEGRLMPAVRARFDSEGFIVPDNVGGASFAVSGVKRGP
jgi:hypothetical protein